MRGRNGGFGQTNKQDASASVFISADLPTSMGKLNKRVDNPISGREMAAGKRENGPLK
jgi:hypothetical protein